MHPVTKVNHLLLKKKDLFNTWATLVPQSLLVHACPYSLHKIVSARIVKLNMKPLIWINHTFTFLDMISKNVLPFKY